MRGSVPDGLVGRPVLGGLVGGSVLDGLVVVSLECWLVEGLNWMGWW